MQPWWLDWTAGLFPVIAVVFILRSFLFEPFKIPSGSMIPTLLVGDFILVNKFAYGIRVPIRGTRYLGWFKPDRGDVIVFVYPEDRDKDFIKRVVGIPGDRIEIRHKILYRNGGKIDEPWAWRTEPEGPAPRDNFGPVTVPEGHVFALGDNRNNSLDSRIMSAVGFIPIENLVGRAEVVFFSVDTSVEAWAFWEWPFAVRWSRLFRSIS